MSNDFRPNHLIFEIKQNSKMTTIFYTEPSEVKIVVLPCNRLPSRSKPVFDEQFLFPTKRTSRRVQIW